MFTAMWAAATGSFREIAMDWELPEGEISSSPFSSSSEDKDTLRVGRAPTTFAARSAASPSTGSKGTSKKNTVAQEMCLKRHGTEPSLAVAAP